MPPGAYRRRSRRLHLSEERRLPPGRLPSRGQFGVSEMCRPLLVNWTAWATNARLPPPLELVIHGSAISRRPSATPLELRSMKNISPILFPAMLVACALGCTSNSDQDSRTPAGSGGMSGAGGATGASSGTDATDWVGTWANAPMLVDSGNLPPDPGLSGNTLRQVLLTSIAGEGFRVQFSNAFGTADLTLTAAHVATSVDADTIEPETDVALSFDGQPSVTIPAGEEVFSDLVEGPSRR
jgi:hypothetical protein